MNTSHKTKSGETSEQIRDIAESGTEQTKEFFSKVGSATTRAASTMQNCCSTALKGMQEYNQKLLEFTRENTQSHFEFVQQLASVKAPPEFFEMSAEHTRRQMEALAEQSKELAAVVQRIALATAEPVKEHLAKNYDRAA
jgi:phasin